MDLFLACVICSDIWLVEAADGYRKSVSLATFVEWFSNESQPPGAEAWPELRTMMQLVFDGSDPDLWQGLAVRAKVKADTNERVFRVVAAAAAGPDERRRASLLRNMFYLFVQDVIIYCSSSSHTSNFSMDIGSARLGFCVAADTFRTDMAARFEDVGYTSCIVMASCLTKLR